MAPSSVLFHLESEERSRHEAGVNQPNPLHGSGAEVRSTSLLIDPH
jgi:hypothetical protein